MEIGVGASTCVSGSQVWNGTAGTFDVMKPMNQQQEHHQAKLLPQRTGPLNGHFSVGSCPISDSAMMLNVCFGW